MQFHEFGDADKPSLMLLPGTCCTWRGNFGTVIPLLEPDFRVICASYDGFDEAEPDAVFPDMLTETARIEAFVAERLGGRLDAVYGCSLGGLFAGLLVQRGNVRIGHAILGSSDLDQESGLGARAKSAIVSVVLTGMLRSGRLPGWMRKRLEQGDPDDRAYKERFVDGFLNGGAGLPFVQRRSVRNQFYFDLVTPLADGIDVPGTQVHVFYATKMGPQYEARYRQHFACPDIRRYDLWHEELLMRYPERWAAEVRACCLS